MKNVRAIAVHMNAFYLLTIHISTDVIAFFHNQAGFSTLFCLVRPYTCIKSASNQYIIIFLHKIVHLIFVLI